MAVSNCASCGSDSFADPLTGIVRRKNEETGQVEPASVRSVITQAAQEGATTPPVLAASTLDATLTVNQSLATPSSYLTRYSAQQPAETAAPPSLTTRI